MAELPLWRLRLCPLTEVDAYRVISQLWLVFVLALPGSNLLNLYLAVTSGSQFAKYLMGVIAFYSEKLPEWQNEPQGLPLVPAFAVEVCLVCATALEFLLGARYGTSIPVARSRSPGSASRPTRGSISDLTSDSSSTCT